MSAVAKEEWVEVGLLSDIPPLGSRIVQTADGDIALFRTADDRLFALRNRCPHKGGPLADGMVHGRRVTCPLHNWVLELESGQALSPDVGCAETYPVRLQGNVVYLSPRSRFGIDD